MLLTSSQVSVAVSSGVVVLCTSALFLSGYVIQQRTLHDLRLAIKEPPPPPPKIYLPDRFKQMTTELEDGTVVVITGVDAEDGDAQPPVDTKVDAEIRLSVPGAEDGQTLQEQVPLDKRDEAQADEGHAIPASSSPRADAPVQPQAEEDTIPTPEVHISRAERRRRIKEEIRQMAYNDKPVLYQRRLY